MKETEIKEIVKETLTELEKQGRVKKPQEKTAYQRTESLLYNLNGFYDAIDFHEQQIATLKEIGAPKKSKSVTSYVANSGLREQKDDMEIVAEKIEDEKKVIYRTQILLNIIESAISELPDEKQPEIIDLIYRDRMDIMSVAEVVGKSHVTVTKNKKQMVAIISTKLFPDEVIKELLY